jgi:hypothetical protein
MESVDFTSRGCHTCKHEDRSKPALPVCWDCIALRNTLPGGNRYPMYRPVVEPIVEPAGIKFDSDKPDWTLLPWKQLATVLQVLTLGAKKYAPDNWKYVPDSPQRYSAALFRHLLAVQDGEWLDPETKLPHLAHVVCNALFLMWHRENKA